MYSIYFHHSHSLIIKAKKTFDFVLPNSSNYDSILGFVCVACHHQSAIPGVACGCRCRDLLGSPGPTLLCSAQFIGCYAIELRHVSHESLLESIIDPNQVEAQPIEFASGLKLIGQERVGPDTYQSSQYSIYH